MFTLPLTPDQVPLLIETIQSEMDPTFLNSLSGDERIAIIVGVSYIETLIEKLIERHFVSSKSKKVNVFKDGLLDTLSSKLRMAYLLGILNEPSFNVLYKVKNLRNDCAHQINVDFGKGKTHGSQLDYIEELLNIDKNTVYKVFKMAGDLINISAYGNQGRVQLVLISLIIGLESIIRLQKTEKVQVSGWSNMILPS